MQREVNKNLSVFIITTIYLAFFDDEIQIPAKPVVEFALRSQHETFPDFGIQPRNDFND